MAGAFIAILKIIFWDIFPPYFKPGNKLTFRGIISPFIAFAMMLIAIQNAPALLAGSITEGYSKAMPEFERLGTMVMSDLGSGGVTSYEAQPPTQTTYSVAPNTNNPSNVQQGTYTVVNGDTLATIALAHEVTPKALADENAIANGIIEIGQVLYIPKSCTYQDASGTVHLCPPIPSP